MAPHDFIRRHIVYELERIGYSPAQIAATCEHILYLYRTHQLKKSASFLVDAKAYAKAQFGKPAQRRNGNA